MSYLYQTGTIIVIALWFRMELPSALFLVFLLVLKLQVFLHLQCLQSETLALYN